MIAKRNRFFILLALLVFSATSGFARLSNQLSSTETSKVFVVAEKDANADQNESITSIREFTGFIVKGNENASSGFQNLQNEKKHLTTNLALISTKTFVAFYSTYCQYRINSMNDSPFYIAYHRLTI
jgi:hypothetical protein